MKRNQLIFLFTLVGLLVTYSIALSSSIEEAPVTLSVRDQSLEEVLKNVEEQTEYKITLRDPVTKIVTIELKEYPLEKSIKRLLAGLNYFMVRDENRKELIIDIIDSSVKRDVDQHHGNDVLADQSTPMAGLAKVEEDYKQAKKKDVLEANPGKRKSGQNTKGLYMSGLAKVEEAYKQARKNGASPESMSVERDAEEIAEGLYMTGLAKVQAAYEQTKKDGTFPK